MTTATAQFELPRVRISTAVAVAGLVAVTAAGAVLRFYAFGRVYTTPYYDAAVRSMGLSWHNFF